MHAHTCSALTLSAEHSGSTGAITGGWHSIYGQVPDAAGLYPSMPPGCRLLLDQSGQVWSIYDAYSRLLHTPYGSTFVFGGEAMILDLWDNDFTPRLECNSNEQLHPISHNLPDQIHDHVTEVATVSTMPSIPHDSLGDAYESLTSGDISLAEMNDDLILDFPTHLTLHASEITRRIPTEICVEIMISSIHIGEHTAARTMSLVCKDWRSIGQGLLFRRLAIGKISGPERGTFHSTLRLHNWRLFASRPHLARHVRMILIGSNPGFAQAKQLLTRLGNRTMFPQIEDFVVTTGSSCRLLFDALPQLNRFELKTDMMKPSSGSRRLEHFPSHVTEVDIHSHQGMLANILETLCESPSARTVKKATFSTILYSFENASNMGPYIAKLTALVDLRVRFSLATRCHGLDPAMRVLQHHSLSRITVDMPDRHHRHVPEDVLRALFGGADLPRLREVVLIVQLPHFKEAKYDLQISLWHKRRASIMWAQPILPAALANQLTLLMVRLESADTHRVSLQRAAVVIEDTGFLNLLTFGTRQEISKVEHKDGIRVMYLDEAMSLGLIDGDALAFSRKRKAFMIGA